MFYAMRCFDFVEMSKRLADYNAMLSTLEAELAGKQAMLHELKDSETGLQ
jgi:hypothetical protein